jgi:localization factor PodJL
LENDSMTSGAPWSVKGIDPKAREVAKDLARRHGMTLGDWLNQMIMEEPETGSAPEPVPAPAIAADEFGRVSEALDRLSTRIESAEHRSTLAISGIDQSVTGLLSRLENAERGQTSVAARFEGAIQELSAEQSKTTARLGKVEEETASPKSLEALRALETALGRVAAHLYDSESRTRESLSEIRADLDGLGGRVGQIDSEVKLGGHTAAVEDAVSRILQRLESAERRTSTSITALETSFSDLDRRIRATEMRNETPEKRLEELAETLSHNIEGVREELVQRIDQAADERFGAVERSLQQMSDVVQTTERRSSQAIERIGDEVVRMAGAVDRRMKDVEAHNNEALAQVGGDVARVADAMEARMRRADTVQTESLEKLGGEIARITERLAERIANAERRSAQAIDDVGEQVARVTDRINQGHERAAHDLAERIRLSEERTARLLEEAREKIDRRLSETHSRMEQVATAPQALSRPPEPAPYVAPDLEPGPFGRDAFGPLGFSDQSFDAPAFAEEPQAPAGEAFGKEAFDEEDFGKPTFGKDAFAEPDFAEPAKPVIFEADDFEAADEFEPYHSTAHADEAEPAEALLEPAATGTDDPTGARATTRDLIAQARAAARASSSPEGKDSRSGKSLFGGLNLGQAKKEKRSAGGSTLKTALLVSAAAAALGIGAPMAVMFRAQAVKHHPAPAAAAANHATASDSDTLEQSAQPPLDAPKVALALTGGVPGPGAGAAALYADSVRRIESHDLGGLEGLRKAANLAYAPAQFYLARLYESGEAAKGGIKKDLTEARRWTERAAQNGDRKAMHNLGLYYFEGTGGAKNTTVAAQWFRKAADLGLVDSQYNLARLYEEGFGVGKNKAEAYKWYLIASRSGDSESVKSAERVKGELSADAQLVAQRAATSFRAETPNGVIAAIALGGQTNGAAAAQEALSRMGYYRGPHDGLTSPALKLAIAAYQRDQGMAQTGVLDQGLIDRFSSPAR